MYVLFGDETCNDPHRDKFYIYGGIFFEDKIIHLLDAEIREIKRVAGYQVADPLKFGTRYRPSHISIEAFNIAKESVLNLRSKYDIGLIACVVHHGISKDHKEDYPVSKVVSKFNEFLHSNSSFGVCVFDRASNPARQFKLIEEKYQSGLIFDKEESQVKISLDNIKMYSVSCIDASNISSLTDVIIGSFGYCINNPQNKEIAKKIMEKIRPIFLSNKAGHIMGHGLILRPKNVKAQKYKAEYQKLVSLLREYFS